MTVKFHRYSFAYAQLEVKGKPVQIRRGPATVMATKAAIEPLPVGEFKNFATVGRRGE